DTFFKAFENEELKGQFKVKVTLEKRPSRLDFNFQIDGQLDTPCDRCLKAIKVETEKDFDLIGKIGEGEEEADIFFIEDQNKPLNIAKFVYEYINYSIPMMKVCDENEDVSCDELLDNNTETEEDSNPVWDVLNKIKFN
ncbi:MAG: DUF177 domain-containing protein, partial [Bacteroidota bacterium]